MGFPAALVKDFDVLNAAEDQLRLPLFSARVCGAPLSSIFSPPSARITFRKNISMRMAVKTEADKPAKIEPPEVHGRLKSDITHGKEKIYERSYY